MDNQLWKLSVTFWFVKYKYPYGLVTICWVFILAGEENVPDDIGILFYNNLSKNF